MPTPVLRAAKNGHYYAVWSDGRRSKRKSMGTADSAVAEARFAQWLLIGGHRGRTGSADGDEPVYTCGDCWLVYYNKHVMKNVVGVETLEHNWAALAPHFKDMAVSDVNQFAVDDYTEKRTTGKIGRRVKEATVRKELGTLFATLRFCAAKPQSMFSSTIIEKVKLPEHGEPRDRWLRMHEIQALLDVAARRRRGTKLSRLERYLWLSLEAPAREQAILDLTWDRVDFETGTIHFDVPGRKKTKKKRVSVAMSKAIRPILERAHEERENDLVMTNKAVLWASVQLAVIEAGLAPPGVEKPAHGKKPKATGISPHTFRHTAATHMARRGVPLWKIAKILGNTLAMVEKVYAKWAPEDPEGTVDMISAGALEPAE